MAPQLATHTTTTRDTSLTTPSGFTSAQCLATGLSILVLTALLALIVFV